MERLSVFVDGFNVYHRLDENPEFHKYKWLDYRSLSEAFLKKTQEIGDIYYFTAYRPWVADSFKRHQNYVSALRTRNIKPVFGKYKRKTIKCKVCEAISDNYHEEKETDVNIALTLILDAIYDRYDTAIIVSADSDLIPAIRAVHQLPNPKRIGVLFPPRDKQKGMNDLKSEADFFMTIKEKHLQNCQLPIEISIGSDLVTRPKEWG
jgi:uncharacterized LabA/DUF88 family protein